MATAENHALKKFVIGLVLAVITILGAAGYVVGLYGYERHSGFFAPAWDKAGKTVSVLRRTTSGFVWGLGWEFFTPPASSYVTSDSFELLAVIPRRHDAEMLARCGVGPEASFPGTRWAGHRRAAGAEDGRWCGTLD